MNVHQEKNTGTPDLNREYRFTDSRHISTLYSTQGDPNEILAGEIGLPYRDYRDRWEKARKFDYFPPFPLQVDYELFYGCNLRCPICILSLPREERLKFGDPDIRLPLETIHGLLEEGAARGQAAAGLNGICEPLLDSRLAGIVEKARLLGLVDVMFSTNGFFLDEEVSRDLIQAGLTRIMISIDAATGPTYDRIRVGSDFVRVTENVRRFIELRNSMGRRLPIVRVSFCVTRVNEHELDAFVDQWNGVADFFSIQHYGNTFEGRFALERSRFFPRSRTYDPGPEPRCAQPNKRVLVRHNGDVIPCCDVSGLDLVIGNVHRESLSDIWHGTRAGQVRTLQAKGRLAQEPVCRNCMAKWAPPVSPGQP